MCAPLRPIPACSELPALPSGKCSGGLQKMQIYSAFQLRGPAVGMTRPKSIPSLQTSQPADLARSGYAAWSLLAVKEFASRFNHRVSRRRNSMKTSLIRNTCAVDVRGERTSEELICVDAKNQVQPGGSDLVSSLER